MISHELPLDHYNTFGLSYKAYSFFTFDYVEDLQNMLDESGYGPDDVVVLGGGSNILLTESLEPLVVHPRNRKIAIIEDGADDVLLSADAGVVWDDLVHYALDYRLYGIENLSMIPGNCGAAPIQNIGAYGVELSEVFEKLEAVDLEEDTSVTFTKADCEFGYRDSIFKRHARGRYCISRIFLRLSKRGTLRLDYGGLRRTLEEFEVEEPSPFDVSKAVRHIRGSKLPDPRHTGNAGSFFKNPVVSSSFYHRLVESWPELPSYPLSEEKVKIPAGWMIDRAGWKGYRHKNAAVHDKQALVLINLGVGDGHEILELGRMIQTDIYERFGISLEPEVNIWDRRGRHIGLANE